MTLDSVNGRGDTLKEVEISLRGPKRFRVVTSKYYSFKKI